MAENSDPDKQAAIELLAPAQREDHFWMEQALLLADQAAQVDEVPVGAVVVYQGAIIGHGFNQPRRSHDPTAHAEIMALREASRRLGNYRLPDCSLYVTIEPCTMCFGAIIHARIARLVYGAEEPRYGAVVSGQRLLAQGQYNHKLAVTAGVLAEPSAERMRRFFRERRR
ncbi:tRNA adenosine(34) deaminase TadA [Pseudohongiella sp. SYSU M77423]|uniref:tRNA adenosine(34) deaminase TadA n=1 Tax=Pseudohongiella sp. SYSU M77423 TaxID=3042312 RepID=UPI002480510D|nr:tRNA adenosine(34) deaminase TadA [Pseudohongiella sp. SYSU M77423]MDH7943513.1 tRNA adenosine(34) deaminase TadA [Pseudohongiella sp. SYSU M77423]